MLYPQWVLPNHDKSLVVTCFHHTKNQTVHFMSEVRGRYDRTRRITYRKTLGSVFAWMSHTQRLLSTRNDYTFMILTFIFFVLQRRSHSHCHLDIGNQIVHFFFQLFQNSKFLTVINFNVTQRSNRGRERDLRFEI